MRECHLIDLLVDCLRYPFNKDFYDINSLTQKAPLTRICQLAYLLLKNCVKDNVINKSYVGKWIDLFFFEALLATDQNNFDAEITIQELHKNNMKMLARQINADIIEKIVNLCLCVQQ